VAFRDPAADIASIASLDDPVRAAVFVFVSQAGGDVSRDQAATAVGVTRRVAAFHLDRLADEGWLDVSYRRLSKRTGPGAGRSSKLSRRSRRAVRVSVPPRNYELLAGLLAAVLNQKGGELDRVQPVASDFGEQLGASARARLGPRPSRAKFDGALSAQLTEQGYEPFLEAGVLRLRNCPFHELARANKDLVCNLNLALMQGLTRGLDMPRVTPAREDREGLCCVAFRPSAS
jgi:predicted ArsR family transcriptional regulator